MLREFQILSHKGRGLKRQRLTLEGAQRYLDSHKDETWSKLVGLETVEKQGSAAVGDYDFWLDIDADQKSQKEAHQNIRYTQSNCRLVVEYLCTRFGAQFCDFAVYFSGHGGFHVLLPFSLPQPFSSADVRSRAAAAVRQWAEELAPRWFKGSRLDLSMYDCRRMIRLPWSRHPSGLRKVPLAEGDLGLSPASLLRKIKTDSASFDGPCSLDWINRKRTNLVLVKYVLDLPVAPAANSILGTSTVPITVERLGNEAPCLTALYSSSIPCRRVDWNKTKLFLLCQLKRFGQPKDLAIELTETFADIYGQSLVSTASKRQERRMEVRGAAGTVFRSQPGSSYDYEVPGRCSNFFHGCVKGVRLLPCLTENCNYYRPRQAQVVTRRIRLEKLLRLGLSANALRIYLELAIGTGAQGLQELSKRVDLSPATVRQEILVLQGKSLVAISATGKKKTVRATVAIVKSFIVKN